MGQSAYRLKKSYIFAGIKGALDAFIFAQFADFMISVFVLNMTEYTIIVAICAVISFGLQMIFGRGNSKKEVMVKALIGSLTFIAVISLCFLNKFTLRVAIFPIRETVSADGLLLLFFLAFYGALVILLHIIGLVFLLLMAHKKEQKVTTVNQISNP